MLSVLSGKPTMTVSLRIEARRVDGLGHHKRSTYELFEMSDDGNSPASSSLVSACTTEDGGRNEEGHRHRALDATKTGTDKAIDATKDAGDKTKDIAQKDRRQDETEVAGQGRREDEGVSHRPRAPR